MSHKRTSVKRALSAFGILLIAGCNNSDFPTTPAPVTQTPLTTLQATKVAGTATLPGGTVTPMNMTLVARSVSLTANRTERAQTPGTTEVSGNFTLGTGVTGSVTAVLDGTLDNGTFRGSLTADAQSCSRQYTGPVSASGIALVATDAASNCPLPTSVQTNRVGGPACSFSIAPVGAVSGLGGSVPIRVTTASGCVFAVESLASFVRVAGAATAAGPEGTVTLTVDPNPGATRDASVRVADQTLTINQGPACTFTVAPSGVTVPAAGGNATVAVTAPAGCPWQVQNLPNWLSASPASSSGTGNVTLTAQLNPGAQRQASVLIAGQTVIVIQPEAPAPPAPCTVSISPTSLSFSAAGGTGTVNIIAPANCPITVQSDVPWILIGAGTSGTGITSVTFTVQANTGAARMGNIRVDGQTLVVTQQGAPDPDCNFTVTPSSTNFPASGGTGTANVSTQAGCPWSAQSFVDWITISGEAGFRGSGTATFIVGPNPAPGERSGAVRIADKIVTITQSGACTFTVFPSNVTVASAGGTASVTVTAPAGCSWQVQNLPIWLSASPVNGSGTGTVTLTAQPNPGGQQQASVLIAGQTVTVVQPAAAPDPCIYTVTGATPSYNFSPSGGNGTVNVTTNLAQCSWSAQSLVDWITITGPAGFTGSGNAAFQVAANSSPQSRQGQLRVAGQLVTITQSGVGTVIVQLQGSGSGQISSFPAGMTCSATTCTGTFSAGSQVTLNAVADPFARFDGWTGSCAQFKTGTCVLTVPAGTISSGATFTALPTLDVVTDNVENAGGNVSSLRLFNCDRHGQPPQSGTCSATLVTGTVLTLFAGFDFPSSEFNGFQGCDTVDVEDMSCTITVTRGARTVRVSFVPAGLPTSAVSGFISAPALQTVPIALFWGLADADQISPLGSDR